MQQLEELQFEPEKYYQASTGLIETHLETDLSFLNRLVLPRIKTRIS